MYILFTNLVICFLDFLCICISTDSQNLVIILFILWPAGVKTAATSIVTRNQSRN